MGRRGLRMLLPTLLLLGMGCSDDSGPAPDQARLEGGIPDGALADSRSDALAGDARSEGLPPDGKAVDGKPAPDSKAADAGTTACGTLICNTATQICVKTVKQVAITYSCETVPTSCLQNRTCACLGAQVCTTSPYTTCANGATGSNSVSCECPNC